MNSSTCVQLPVYEVNSELVTELCTASLKHILFIREQIPVTFDTIVENNELSTHRPSIRKIETFLSHISTIEENLYSICSILDVVEIQLIFGPSLTSPKEIYCLHLPRQQQDRGNTPEETMKKKHRECIRRTIRSYIHHWGEVDCRPLSSTNTFIAIRPHDSTSSAQYADAMSAASCFGYRQHIEVGLVSKMKKRCQPSHHHWFRCKEEESDKEEQQAQAHAHAQRKSDDQHDHEHQNSGRHSSISHDPELKQEEEREPGVIMCSGKRNPATTDRISVDNNNADNINIDDETGDWKAKTVTTVKWLVLKKGIKGLKNIRLNT